MPRLFTALEIPADIASQLMLHRGGLAGARWIEPSDYHITIRFLGDIDRRLASEVDEALAGLSGAPFQVSIDGLDSFGGGKPRALYARVQPSEPLMSLQADHERLLRRLGLPLEPRKFVPHVTLARLRETSAPDVAHFLAQHAIVRPLNFTAQRFTLMSSRESVGGGPYVVEAAFPFTPAWSNRPTTSKGGEHA